VHIFKLNDIVAKPFVNFAAPFLKWNQFITNKNLCAFDAALAALNT
jgi:hypothetical protein